ncbi:glycosyltransferase [Cupriavidus sp. UYPR2.512]|uniref:glycosyltransferase family 4 protein n=1 Tax=Cupriavidus sp. UYPR2.512 TaxID=1080187 RepID=UPI00037BFA69
MRPAQPSQRLRIAYLITNSEIGGAQSHVGDLLQSMQGRAETVLLAGGDGPLFDIAARAGAETRRLTRLDNALSPWRAVTALHELVHALKSAAPDLIHVHSAKAGALGRIAGLRLGLPVVYTVHGFAFKPEAPWRQRLAARAAEWLLAPLASRVICVAEAERRLASSLPVPADRIAVIPNGIPDTAHRAAPQAPLRRLVMVARFAAPKRPDAVIRAFARANLRDCELVLAGDGPQRTAMEQLAQQLAPGRVRFPGNVADIPALLASAQAFVLASDHEGFPLSVLEAMRAGLPVTASDLPGIREQIGHNSHGLLVDHDDESEFSAALEALASDSALRGALGSAARRRWEQHYGLDQMTEATWSVYRDALASNPRGASLPT